MASGTAHDVPVVRRRGRPTDPTIEARVFSTALVVYSEVGWAGFTIDAVAARASVGKASIYSRWPNKQDLLVAALMAIGPETFPQDRFVGEIRQDLITYVEDLVTALCGPSGLLHVRVQMESKTSPGVLGSAMEDLMGKWVAGARALVADAIERGELPDGASTSLLFDVIRGAALNRYLSSPPDREARFLERRHEFASQLVDLVLAGLRA